MRFKQYLKENKTVSFEEVITMIWNDCQPYLKDLIKTGKFRGFMYSGRSSHSSFFKGNVHSYREPKDTDKQVHEMLDNKLKKKFGWNGRSNSIFCTGNKKQADNYGYIFIIFPTNKYKFIYNPDVEDFVDVIPEDIYEWDEFLDKDEIDDKIEDDALEEWEEKYNTPGTLGNFYYDGNELPDNIRDENDAEEFILNNLSDFDLEEEDDYSDYELQWVPEMDLESFIDYEYRDYWMQTHQKELKDMTMQEIEDRIDSYVSQCKSTDIHKAIKTGNEIMVNCKEYYAFSSEDYEKPLLLYFHKVGYVKPTTEVLEKFYKDYYHEGLK
jgi:hypothetical protein